MGNQKLVWCCIAGIILGYLAPFFIAVNRGTSLSIGMIAGLGIGYLLEVLGDRKNQEEQQEDNAVLNQKAQEANKLLEQARAEVSGDKKTSGMDRKKKSAEEKTEIAEPTLEEQSEKLNEAEALLRKARAGISGDKKSNEKDRKEKSAEEKTEIAGPTLEEESEKMNEAETLLRQAREQLKK